MAAISSISPASRSGTAAAAAGASVRQRLLTATARLIYRDGITATGVESIAAAASVAKMSLYRHFPGGKDELVAAALAKRSRDVVGRLLADARRLASASDPHGADQPGPVATILAVFDVVDRQTQQPHWRGCPFLNAAAELPQEHPGRAVVLAHKRDLNEHLAGLVRDAGLDPAEHLASILVLLLDGALAASALTPEEHPAALARGVAAGLLGGPHNHSAPASPELATVVATTASRGPENLPGPVAPRRA
ncbi:MAG TPA: TetR/AcrR family transcriptional regulator [Pseudonocardia sp.]|nr:TetR/AcrR family transcriptional regulator [Pseudonocardia sp.]